MFAAKVFFLGLTGTWALMFFVNTALGGAQ